MINKSSFQTLRGHPSIPLYADLAMAFGGSVTHAIIFQQISYWINNPAIKNRFENRNWVHNTYKQWNDQFPYWSKNTIERTLNSLENNFKVIISISVSELTHRISESGSYENIISIPNGLEGNYKYYTIDYEVLELILQGSKELPQNGETPHPKMGRPPPQNGETPTPKWGSSYIDTKTTQRLHREREHSASANSVFSENAPPPQELEKTHKKKKERGSSLNEDWILPPEYRSWSLQIRMTNEEIDITALKFKNYWLSTTKNATKKDWYRTWQNWCFGDYNLKSKNLKLPDKPVSVGTVPKIEVIKKSSNPKIQQWYNLQPALKDMVGDNDYISWFGSNLELIKADDKAILKASSKFLGDYVRLHYISYVSNILAQIDPNLGKEENIEFIL